MTTGYIHSYESLGGLDGPGLRLVVFFSGCPLRCLYCHNPDTWALETGSQATPQEVFRRVQRLLPYFSNGGGVTLSGGEPLLQPEFAREILRLCRDAGISTCLDTAGSLLNQPVKEALAQADLILLDVKHTDPDKYTQLTGGCYETAQAFLDYCKALQLPLWIRQVILPGFTDTPDYIASLLQHIEGANVKKLELLPYHTLGKHKWQALKLPYELEDVLPPDQAKMDLLWTAAAPFRRE